MTVRSSLFFVFLVALSAVVGSAVFGSVDASDTHGGTSSSLSYKGHENDFDSNALVKVYPRIFGTRLDDCQTCHGAGKVSDRGGTAIALNPCSFCHLIPFPDTTLVAGVPGTYEATLNPFGLDYKKAGRNTDALARIAGADSDADSHTNGEELQNLCYPGDPASKPGQPTLPIRTFGLQQLKASPTHEQFLLLNSHKQQYDNYAMCRGIKVKDLLEAAGADLSVATSVTMIAPDGFATDFTLVSIGAPYPAGLYHANLGPGDFADSNQGVVQYPDAETMPKEVVDGGEIPGEQWLMIAYVRDGGALDPCSLDPASGKLDGEGPYRLIAPQSSPGRPDRGSKYSPSGVDDGYDYSDGNDHNAGLCVRGLVAIRVNPIPQGYEEFDWKNGGWSLVERGEIIVYGAGITSGVDETE